MSILVVGSVGLDDVETPSGKRTGLLGGACTYFATAASLYTRVHMVAVIGTDFPTRYTEFLRTRDIDLQGLQVAEGETFYWAGRYGEDCADAETLDTQLNVFADFHPVVPQELRDSEYVFLANIDPDLQIEVLQQMSRPRLTAVDSMNFWMLSEAKRASLTRVLSMVDVAILNETEVRMYARKRNLFRAADDLMALGLRALIIKRGEHGATLVTRGETVGERYFALPAYPLETVVDPTGAGDTFAAGFMGYLARTGDLSVAGLRRAVVHGTVVASFTVQDFSIDRLRHLTMDDIEARYHAFRCITYFDAIEAAPCASFEEPITERA